MTELNEIELNAVLYYADFISLLKTGIPITDTCKYFFIYNTPINSACIAGNKPIYDPTDQYFLQSVEEYTKIKDKFGEDGVLSFIDNICSLSACGKVSGQDMLKCIHRYSNKKEQADAINKYNQHMNNLQYEHDTKDDEGKTKREKCSKYVAHFEIANRLDTRPELLTSN